MALVATTPTSLKGGGVSSSLRQIGRDVSSKICRLARAMAARFIPSTDGPRKKHRIHKKKKSRAVRKKISRKHNSLNRRLIQENVRQVNSTMHPYVSVDELTLDLRDFRDNCIIVKDHKRVNGVVTYAAEPCFVGKNVQLSEKDQHGNIVLKISKVKNKKILLLSKIDDALKIKSNENKKVLLLSMSTDPRGRDDKYVILMGAIHQEPTMEPLSNEFISKFEQQRPTMRGDGTRHHGSRGLYIGLGATAHHRKISEDKLSFGPFAGTMHNEMQQRVMWKFQDGEAAKLNRAIPGILLGNLVPKVLRDMGSINKDFVGAMDRWSFDPLLGFLAVWCRQCSTEEYHVEWDCSYTVVSTPSIEEDNNNNNLGVSGFSFSWDPDSDSHLTIEMEAGTVIFFAGHGIMHKQIVLKPGRRINMACYHNSKFFCHVRSSLRRLGLLD